MDVREVGHEWVDLLADALGDPAPGPEPEPPPDPPEPPAFEAMTLREVELAPVFEDRFTSAGPAWVYRLPWDKAKNPMGPNGAGGRYIGEELEIYLDPTLGDPSPFEYGPHGLTIYGWALSEAEKADHLARMREAGNVETKYGYWGRKFGSGMLSGCQTLGQVYGFYEWCIRSDYWDAKDVGNFSAAWLCKQKDHSSGAPRDDGKDELDPQETIAGDPDPRCYQTVHAGQRDTAGAENTQVVTKDYDAAQWHTVAVLWTPDEIVFYLDGAETLEWDNYPPDDPEQRGLHSLMFPILNQAIGGNWPVDLGAIPHPDLYNSTTQFAWFRMWSLETAVQGQQRCERPRIFEALRYRRALIESGDDRRGERAP